MSAKKPISARAIAREVLNQFDPKRDYASELLDKILQKTGERQRATDLVFGTIRNRMAIDAMITKFTDCATKRIPSEVLNIIRIGVYELVYSPETPDYSIVNEAVENAKSLTGKKQTGFVNAALRQIVRHITNRQTPLSQAKGKKTLPQTPTTGCEFDMDILPDTKTLPADYLSTVFSLPKWLVEDWLDEYGTEATRQICFASNRKPSIYIRTNTLKTTSQKLAGKLLAASIDIEVVPDVEMIKIKSPKAVTQLPGFDEGEFVVQDISAAQAVRLLGPLPDWKILDLCAAPGAKTTQLAEATGDKAHIFATDIGSERLKMVGENITRLGIKSVRITEYKNLQKQAEKIGLFDCILLDVPCSNTGVFARRIEARYRITPNAIKALTDTQASLLKTAALMIKLGGKLCYSTCSIQKQENSELINRFLRENPDFKLESEKLTLPTASGAAECDGVYTAIIAKKT